MTTDAILFDLDGTLVDHDTAARAGVTAWSEDMGIRPDPDQWVELDAWGFREFASGRLSMGDQRRERVRRYTGQQLDDASADALFSGYVTHYESHWTRYDDALPALQRALSTGRPVGILTNGQEEVQNRKLAATGLDLPELVMLSATGLDSAKPRPEMYSRALERLGTSNAILIGDDWVNDVEKPRQLGWKAVFIDRMGRDERADITTLDDLIL